jgi:hypothetical protein
LDPLSRASEDFLITLCFKGSGDSEMDKPDGLVLTAATGSGHARDGEREINS